MQLSAGHQGSGMSHETLQRKREVELYIGSKCRPGTFFEFNFRRNYGYISPGELVNWNLARHAVKWSEPLHSSPSPPDTPASDQERHLDWPRN